MSNFWKWIKKMLAGLLILVLGLSALTYAAGAFAKSKLTRENPPPGKLTDVGGYNMHLYCMGEGSPTVILEAGLNDFHVSWSKVQAEIAKDARACSYDRAGLGWSEASPHPRTSKVMAEELHTLLMNSGIEGPYILVGHSFGGIIVRLFAQKYSDEVAGMVLVDSAHEEQMTRLPFLKDSANEFISQFRTLSAMSSFGLMALSPATIPNRGFPEEAYKQYQAVLATTDYFSASIAESTGFYSNTSSTKIAEMGDLPLIVLSHGLPDSTSDDAVEQNQFEQEWTKMQSELANLSSNSRQIIAKQSGHYIQLDEPNLVIDAVRQIVESK